MGAGGGALGVTLERRIFGPLAPFLTALFGDLLTF